MLRRLILFPVKLPFRIARFAFQTLTGRSSSPSSGHTQASGRAPERPAERPADRAPERPAERPAPAGPDPRSVQTSPEEIFEMQKQGVKVVFVDVREPGERAGGIIDGALLIPSGQVTSRYAEFAPEDEIVLYCASGMRSTNAAIFLHGQGYSKAKSLVGGFSHWVRDGGKTSVPARA